FDIVELHRLVAVGRSVAFRCGKECPFAVRFYRTSFQYEIEMATVVHLRLKNILLVKLASDLVIVISCEFQSPCIESEIENNGLSIQKYRESAVVACPCIVASYHSQEQVFLLCFVEVANHIVLIGTNNEKFFAFEDFLCDGNIACGYLVEHVEPVGSGMGPRQLHTALR